MLFAELSADDRGRTAPASKYSTENHGGEVLFAELSAEIEGVGDAAAEAIF